MALSSLPECPSTEQARKFLRCALREVVEAESKATRKRSAIRSQIKQAGDSGLTKSPEIRAVPMMTSKEVALAIKKLDKMIEDEQKSLDNLQKKDNKDDENGTDLQTILD